MKQGNIGVTSENIFPVIKKFLYSDQEIFLRELVSNAVDATQKLKTLSSVGEFKGELGNLNVQVKLDKEAGTLTISDRGIGMTAEEIDKYINQIAFSGAEEFLDKYKNDANAIIGHFGLGFYSSFMVAKKVEIISQSYKEGTKAVKWSCEGNPDYTMEETEKADRGTDIILYIDDESKDFLEESRINTLLNKYCKFLPIAVAFGKKKEWKDGKQVDTAEDNIINNTEPAWVKKPADLKDEDYSKFYRELYPFGEEPLFHIHLNVDYPFNLTGILYFPKVKNNIELQRNKIQLFCNQVFVTDSVEGIVPEFLTLLHGVIDSPDIPLNVSRSYLQSDANVKKISTYITKKVADQLTEIFNKERSEYESKWDSLKIFIQYGMLTDEKFNEKAGKFNLLKDIDGKYHTLDEYKSLIEGNQTDKDGNLIVLYTNDAEQQYSYIEAAKNKGYNVLLMDGQLDIHLASKLEQANEKMRFVRVDSDVIDRLIVKANAAAHTLTNEQQTALQQIFRAEAPAEERKTEYIVSFEAMGAESLPVIITQSEYMRRMKEMAAMQGGMMSFYGEMPDTYNLVLNTDHALIQSVLQKEEAACDAEIKPMADEIEVLNKKIADIRTANGDKKEDEYAETEKEVLRTSNDRISELNKQKEAVYAKFGKNESLVRQLIDLALLSNNMLKGQALSDFVKRSVNFIK
ncbi:MAG: molecular chaperone HtpG [Paludibacteraceae bacterium]|nr:molecular chaperone HtpG [Paludibacteraceae bacterium]